jgi:CO/xanthine dehydrogenase Mo-binding subunit
MTGAARRALARAGLSRRDFLKGSGALIVSFSAASAVGGRAGAQGPFDTRIQQIDPRRLDSWIAVGADGRVTACTGKCELGQGMQTAQMQLVAEELSVPFDRVSLVQCDTAMTPDQGTTSGSQSTPGNFNAQNLALAAATARETLIAMAAQRLGVAPADLAAIDGAVVARGDSSRRVSYGELIGGRRFDVPLKADARRKPSSEWKVLGTSQRRVDMTAMVTGQLEYVHHVNVPGMLHGRVVRPPAVGATLASVDERSIRDIPGVVQVVVRKSFVGVVAETQWQAARAAGALRANWTRGSALPARATFYEWLRKQPSRDALLVDSKSVDDALARAPTVLRATYFHPYQMHGAIGASCAVADVREGGATVWSSTQSAYPLRSGVAMLLGLPAERVRVIFVRGAGCYGINGADTVSYDAALMSQAVGRPVRVQLSRADEMAWENFGSAYVIDQRVGIGTDGAIDAWDYEAWVPTRGGRPGYDRPGNVITGTLAGFEPNTVVARAAAAPGGTFDNGSNAAPSYVTGCAGTACGGTGLVKNERVLTHTVNSPFYTGPLRSPARLQNTFAHECFMDEAAARVRADPVEYRLRHLRDPRLREVVSVAATAAKWQPRPSPSPNIPQTGAARGRGIACVLYEGDNGYCAMVAEVEVDVRTGAVAVQRLVMGHDCGPMSNPDGVRQQLEGGALQGMSRALGEEVAWDDRRVTSVDWRSYRSLPLGFRVPAMECVLIDRAEGPAMGAGETSITLSAAAIGNAIFDATGARIREVPFTPDRIRRALEARTA